MTFLAFADAHPWPAVALCGIAAVVVLVIVDHLAPTRKPPGGAP